VRPARRRHTIRAFQMLREFSAERFHGGFFVDIPRTASILLFVFWEASATTSSTNWRTED